MPESPGQRDESRLEEKREGSPAAERIQHRYIPETERSVRSALDRTAGYVDRGQLPEALTALEALPNETDRVEYAATYDELPEGVRELVEREDFLSDAFLEAARARAMTPYQWAGVAALWRQGIEEHDLKNLRPDGARALRTKDFIPASAMFLSILPDPFIVDETMTIVDAPIIRLPKHLAVGWNLSLIRCKALVALPDGIGLRAQLSLDTCPALENLPDDLWVGGSIEIRRCRRAVMKKARVLAAKGRIHGTLNFSPV